jgi:hypothetical protein
MRTLKYMFTCKRRLNGNVQEEASGIRWHRRVGKRFVLGKRISRQSVRNDISTWKGLSTVIWGVSGKWDTKLLNMYNIFNLQKRQCEWIACT